MLYTGSHNFIKIINSSVDEIGERYSQIAFTARITPQL